MKVHTLELSASLSHSEYQICRDIFFEDAEGKSRHCYEKSAQNRIVYNRWISEGLIIYLIGSPWHYLHLRLTPAKVLGDTEPTALFEPQFESVCQLSARVEHFMNAMPITLEISRFSLFRIDLCNDHITNSNTEISEYLRLLNKGAKQDGWQSCSFGDNRDNHSFRKFNTRYCFTVYDKLFQLEERGISTNWSVPQKILRVEVALLPDGIYHLRSKGMLPQASWQEQLLVCGTTGEKIMSSILQKVILSGDYYTFCNAAAVIQNSSYSPKKKENILRFLRKINTFSVLDAPSIKTQAGGKKRLSQLRTLGINPVTIEENIEISFLPSLFPAKVSVL